MRHTRGARCVALCARETLAQRVSVDLLAGAFALLAWSIVSL